MRAEELMIGDWVQDSSGAKFKIINIEHHCTRVEYKGEELILPCFEQANIKPIPLTPEILEKNGFEMVLDKNKVQIYRIKWPINHDYYFSVWTGLDGYWNPVGFGVTIGGVQGDVDYVHQLQHALKLCRINKEIEL